jgi:hypothetical protein
VPSWAQKRAQRGPLAALLILLGLLVSAAPFATANSVRDSVARLGTPRQGASSTFLRTSERLFVPNGTAGEEVSFLLPPPEPQIVLVPGTDRPLPPFATAASCERPPAATSSYRARAPPAA